MSAKRYRKKPYYMRSTVKRAGAKRSKPRRPDHMFRVKMTITIIAVALAVACICAVQWLHPQQADINQPLSTPSGELEQVSIPDGVPSQVKRYEGFTVNFNTSNRTANYVSWELLGSETDGASSRDKEKFWRDEDIKNCPSTSDYTRSGFDRGHLYPAADAKWSAESMRQCFTMANITPQIHALNGGAWKTLEDKERQWARRDSALVVIAGPVYQQGDTQRIGKAGVRVPSAYFKVLLAPYVANPRTIAFVYPNEHCPGNMQNYAQSVDYVESITGFDFFTALPDDVEQQIESTYSFKEWNKR